MTMKDIRTAHAHVECDVCGRTLLRGERAETYLAGGTRRDVCELCTARAIHEGWVREDAALERATRSAAGERRRSFSLFGRLRRPKADGSLPDDGWNDGPARRTAPARQAARPVAAAPEPVREVRHVHAVPTSVEQRTVTAVERFNASEHPRTVAGVARSLGAPAVVVRPLEEHGSTMTIVVAWELCWYRYELELADDDATVRPAGQGYELDELDPEDRAEPNAVADEHGELALV